MSQYVWCVHCWLHDRENVIRFQVNEKFTLVRIVNPESGSNLAYFFSYLPVGGRWNPDGSVKINTHLQPGSRTRLRGTLPLLPI